MALMTNMKIGKRLGMGFGIMVLFLVLLGIVAYWSTNSINTSMTEMKNEYDIYGQVRMVKGNIYELFLQQSQFLLFDDKMAQDEVLGKVDEFREKYKKAMDQLKATAQSSELKRLLAEAENKLSDARGTNKKVVELAKADKM